MVRAFCRASTTSFSSWISMVKRFKVMEQPQSSYSLCHQNRHIISFPAEIAMQNRCDNARMLVPDPGIAFQIPARNESVRMHNQNAFRVPGVGKFLNSRNLVAHGAIVRSEASAHTG